MKKLRFFDEHLDLPEKYLSHGMRENLMALYNELNRNLDYDKNFLSQTIRITIPAATTSIIGNPLRDKKGEFLEPNAWFILQDSGHRSLGKGSTWNNNYISFSNTHASQSGTFDILVMKTNVDNIQNG